jgi:hypothetical protein
MVVSGWLVFAFFLTLGVLRLIAVPEARLAGGILIMGAGIWLIWIAAVHPLDTAGFRHAPDIFPLVVGLWLVVRGALRFASY